MNYRAELNQLINTANDKIIRGNLSPHRICLQSDKLVLYNPFTDYTFTYQKQLSPRMSIKNLCNWLDGFISGLEF